MTVMIDTLCPDTDEKSQLSVGIIEDDKSERENAGKLLKRRGCIVNKASSAEEALTFIPKCDALWVDIMLPGKNGIDLIIEINRKYPAIKVMFITAYSELVQKVNRLAIPHDLLLEKPLVRKDYDEMYSLLKEWADKKQKRDNYLYYIRNELLLVIEDRASDFDKQQAFVSAKRQIAQLWESFPQEDEHRKGAFIQLRLTIARFSIVPSQDLGLVLPNVEQLNTFIEILDILIQPALCITDEIKIEQSLRNVGIETGLEIPGIEEMNKHNFSS